MSGQTGRDLAPPGGLRPAQLGIVLVGRVLLGHVGATVVDLASRGYLTVAPLDEDCSDWLLTAVPAVPEDLLGYEQAIMHGFFGKQAAFRLEHMSLAMTPVLDQDTVPVPAPQRAESGPGCASCRHRGPER